MTDLPALAGRRDLTIRLEGSFDTSIEPSASAGVVVFMSWVPESRIPSKHIAYVRRHVGRAADMLGLPPVSIRWFGAPVGGGDFWGRAPGPDQIPAGVTPDDQPLTVAINASLRGDVVAFAVAHEVRHIAQHLASGTYGQARRVVAAAQRDDTEYVASVPTREPAGIDVPDPEADADLFATEYMHRIRD